MRQLRKDTPLGRQEEHLKRKYKTIKNYTVSIPVNGYCLVTIKAKNMAEALKMFHAGELTEDNMNWEVDEDSIEPDWSMFEHLIEEGGE